MAHGEKVDCMVRENRRVKQNEIANEVGISKEQGHHIVTTVLGPLKISACWVPRQLTVEMKAQRKSTLALQSRRSISVTHSDWRRILGPPLRCRV
ncbi:histone-lysine n-methyltransferase setmar [Elysia marginata]|uniref:Histone-lysine n-methyltransferase setmar n=1 Tax=Elysia marginata TaxID=1093978 RepID=A0AAV4GMT0_9GAST|nr:histone-lysine n-methyltransferase setmar [Elysia marginata]